MKKTNQQGFGSIELIIIIVVLVAIGGGGYWIYSRQNGKNSKASTTSTSKEVSDQSSKATTIEDATSKIESKIYDLASGRYKVENTGTAKTSTIQISATQTVTVASDNDSVYYRQSPFAADDSSADAYDAYMKKVGNDFNTLDDYITGTLGLEKVYNQTTTNPALDKFEHNVYKVGGYYLEVIGGGQSNGSVVVSWGK